MYLTMLDPYELINRLVTINIYYPCRYNLYLININEILLCTFFSSYFSILYPYIITVIVICSALFVMYGFKVTAQIASTLHVCCILYD